MKHLIVGDIAGRFDELQALIAQVPEYDYILAVGDLTDRGQQSREVVEFFINVVAGKKGNSLLGNHEHMLVDHVKKTGLYYYGCWFSNGGYPTLDSFGGYIPRSVVDFLSLRPRYKIIPTVAGDVLVSHSFIHPDYDLKIACDVIYRISVDESSIIWNREYPIRRPEYTLQVAGHNSQWSTRWFKDGNRDFALSIDSSKEKILTGIVVDTEVPPTRENIGIFQQEYLK